MRAYGNNLAGQDKREVSMKFKVVKVVGKGSYGTVYQVQRLSDNKTYALKEMDVRAMNQAEREDAANEIRLLASVKHPNVVTYNEAFLDGNRICIIMDFADGDLTRVIKKYQVLKRPMPEDLVWKYFIQICFGLLALHKMKILHRDIKPGNIMIMADDTVKIGDLGIAKLLSKTVAAKTQIGTPHYMPPEIWKNRPYGFQSDSWAVGCLLYEMLTLKVPFEARNINELRTKVTRGTYPPLPSSTDRDLVAIVRECLDQDPNRRPTMEGILSMPAVLDKLHLMPYNPELARAPAGIRNNQQVMIDTIKVPRNFQMIKGKLPPAQYGGDPQMMMNGASDDEMEVVAKLPSAMIMQHQQPQPNGGGYGRPQIPHQLEPVRVSEGVRVSNMDPGVPVHGQGLRPVQQGGRPSNVQPAVDPVLLQMQQKAAMIGNVYNAYQKNNQPGRPSDAPSVAPSAVSKARERYEQLQKQAQQAQPWYAQPVQQSESRSAYGAFYANPSSAAAGQQRAQPGGIQDPRNGVDPRQPQQYRGFYTPSQASNAGGPAAGYQNGGAARAGGWPVQQAKLPPVAEQQRQLMQQQQQQQQQRASAASSKPPPWNYGGGPTKPMPPGYRAGGPQPQAQQQVSRYPPQQWSPPRMR